MTEKVYQSAAWRKVRLTILERDNYTCQIRLKGCTQVATQVDHIVPVSAGGAWLEPTNLRGACAGCNTRRTKRSTTTDRWRSARTRLYLIIGPPCPGLLLQYVEANRSIGDLVVDYGQIAAAFGGDHKTTTVARGALLSALRRGEVDAPRAWVTSSNPEARSIFVYHEVRVVDPGEPEALRLVQEGGHPELAGAVRDWYSTVGLSRAS